MSDPVAEMLACYRPVQGGGVTFGERVRLAAWVLVRSTLYRWSPAPCRGWRRTLLRLFGATVAGTASPHPKAVVDYPWNLSMGHRSSIGAGSWIFANGGIVLGAYVCVGQQAHLITAGHDIRSPGFDTTRSRIEIGDGSWIAVRAIILPGVKLGRLCVVGAGAVVTRSVPDCAIVAGNPAKIIGVRKWKENGGASPGNHFV